MAEEPITVLLRRMGAGDREAGERVFALVYAELRARAGGLMGAAGGTLQPTAIVHEAWIKLAGSESGDWRDRGHFLAFAASAMRSILVDHARAKRTAKRGGGAARIELDRAVAEYEDRAVDLVALDEALAELATLDPELARVVELRFFGGSTIAETAQALGISTATVERDWRTARSWLRQRIDGGEEDG